MERRLRTGANAVFAPLGIPILMALATLGMASGAAQAKFFNFESGQVRPLALSPDGARLFAVNTPDNRIEIFDVGAGGLTHVGAVPVGLEPVAVAARTNDEIWVVNHLSDNVSIVTLTGTPHVVRTLLVGDEPRDIVFAGTGGNRAFITTAHRGQHRTHSSISGVSGAGDPQLITPSVPRADVWVFDATNLGSTLGGTPVEIVELFGDTPRALAVAPDGNTVYAAIFHSGNQTTTVSDMAVCDGFDGAGPCNVDGETMPGGSPGPDQNAAGDPAPEVGLIIKYDNGQNKWLDEDARDWSDYVQFNLPDHDVFAIDANTLASSVKADHVGTILFNMVVHPTSGRLYVSNTESPNEVRFEGPGNSTTTVQGHLSEARISVIDGSTVAVRHLNKHIDYGIRPAPAGTKNHSLATPLGMQISEDGSTLYVAAFGSSKIGVVPVSHLDSNWAGFDPTTASANYIGVSGGGPSGLVLDERVEWQRMYVLTRFDNAISVIDLGTGTETDHLAMFSPEPPEVVDGRPFLYDAFFTSSNGEASCSSCHIFGDNDNLAWDLGNPDDDVTTNPIPINLGEALVLGGQVPPDVNGSGELDEFHPMKGPMTTQTLRGMKNSGAMHWRGDRSQPGNFAFNELENFKNFDVAFVGLVGRNGQIPSNDMDAFADFALSLILPPNPVRNLDNSLTSDQLAGKDFFDGPRRSDGLANDVGPVVTGFTCEGCHTLAPGVGFFGTNGNASFEAEPQIIKIPHLRNMYTKVGMFGLLDLSGIRPLNTGFQGDQIRGFGFTHDGSADTLFRFFNALVFEKDFAGPGVGFDGPQQGNVKRRQVEQFMLAFDTDLAPMIGQQVTLDAGNLATVEGRIDAMQVAADTPFVSEILGITGTECQLVVKGTIGGQPHGWLYFNGNFTRSDGGAANTPAQLKALATTEGPLTYTCTPTGTGLRMGLDRDEDLDFDSLDNCPAVPNAGQENFDGDGAGDVCDTDDDNDGVPDGSDPAPMDPDVCGDADTDTCDDCAVGSDDLGPLADNDPANDGTDSDADGLCDLGDPDDDGDGVPDIGDNCPLIANPAQTDTDGDLAGDACDADDDNDGLADGADQDALDPALCEDSDADGCDDCAVGVDGFGPLADNDPANDGADTNGNGVCDLGDSDDDSDGVADGSDVDTLNPSLCEDADFDTCDDCSVGTDGLGPLADNDPQDDGTDTDADGACDLGDPDDDGDGLLDLVETNTGVFVDIDDTGTNPLLQDTDGDGWTDPDEITLGSDPNDPLSLPLVQLPVAGPTGWILLVMLLGASAGWRLRRPRDRA